MLPGFLATFFSSLQTWQIQGAKSCQVATFLASKPCTPNLATSGRGKLQGFLATFLAPKPGNFWARNVSGFLATFLAPQTWLILGAKGCHVSWQLFWPLNVARFPGNLSDSQTWQLSSAKSCQASLQLFWPPDLATLGRE